MPLTRVGVKVKLVHNVHVLGNASQDRFIRTGMRLGCVSLLFACLLVCERGRERERARARVCVCVCVLTGCVCVPFRNACMILCLHDAVRACVRACVPVY